MTAEAEAPSSSTITDVTTTTTTTTTVTTPHTQQTQRVSISSVAQAKMILHSLQYNTTQIHGVLVGTYDDGLVLRVVDCVPVCHSSPTKPLLDMALRLVETSLAEQHDHEHEHEPMMMVVGWYTANERVNDANPSPAALRVVASVAETTKSLLPPHAEPVLVLINALVVADIMSGGAYSENDSTSTTIPLEVFGRDHRKHWVRPVPQADMWITEEQRRTVHRVCRGDDDSMPPIFDFESHLTAVGPQQVAERDWLCNDRVTNALSLSS